MTATSFLYVEDDPLSREVIRIALKDIMRYEKVWIFEDSENFLDRVQALECVPDVILLDIHMTPVNGFEMLKLLRGHDTFTRCQVIALTASVMNEEVTLLRESGFDGAIGKPIDPDVFPDLIRQVVGGEKIWYIAS
jgi:DNA-binding NarL/FixJ family response regulator